jgi:hypothetical protein
MKKIKAEVDTNGHLNLEFAGFAGEECIKERERLRQVLVDLGVSFTRQGIKRKSSSQISQELSQSSTKGLGLDM